MKKNKKEILKWVATIAVIAVFYFTGWHRPLIAKLQQAVLSTGIIKPDISGNEPISELADTDAHFYDENGNRVSLSEFRGKPVFLNIWATWCPPCRAEMPGIQKLYTEIGGEKASFIMLSTDADFAKAVKFKKDNGYDFPIYRLAASLPEELDTESLPTTYVFDKEGRMHLSQKGMAKYDSEEFKVFMRGLF
ncbi:TlpA family protein disulfide reductase [Cryomorpha ignava]|uniref:TlpA family protein disulfide reductase n=1 Tax=Cryomorpha ignava TaxID=101383 RepID=A0A7K3WRE8_9FLAO|nr:TlpA disulfide reductase family protein [Cryomorpha ignava]NEN23285.1 TlpA family protein disulfide reductase [Cryomorpha ignava]